MCLTYWYGLILIIESITNVSDLLAWVDLFHIELIINVSDLLLWVDPFHRVNNKCV